MSVIRNKDLKILKCDICGNKFTRIQSREIHCDRCKKFRKKLTSKLYYAQRKPNINEWINKQDGIKLLKKQEFKCALCGDSLNDDISVDHIIPFSRGGSHTLNNIRFVHKKCNYLKDILLDCELIELCVKIYNNLKGEKLCI